MSCTHQTKRQVWVEGSVNDWGYEEPGHYDWATVQTTEDIDVGRYRCTQCKEVMYYTGTWRKHWTGQ